MNLSEKFNLPLLKTKFMFTKIIFNNSSSLLVSFKTFSKYLRHKLTEELLACSLVVQKYDLSKDLDSVSSV